MRTRAFLVIAILALASVAARAAEPAPLANRRQRMSYALGADLARNLKAQGGEVDADALSRGLRDWFAGSKLALSDGELKTALAEFQTEMRNKMKAARGGGSNAKVGAAFLAANKAKPGVVTTASGLQYKVLRTGTGKKPTDADTVSCTYRGTLVDGTEFDASPEGKPASLQVAKVIPGWREALKLMPAGSKWELVVPPQLGYGSRGVGKIGPSSTLVFELELLDVK